MAVLTIKTSSAGDVERRNINLAELCEAVAREVALPKSYVLGKTAIRDALMDRLGCSALLAENLVDRMELAGLIQFEMHRLGGLVDTRWEIEV